MANSIQRSVSDKGRRALRRFTPAVCQRAWNLYHTPGAEGAERTGLYDVGAALGLHPHQARSAVNAWDEVLVAANALGVEPAAVAGQVVQQ